MTETRTAPVPAPTIGQSVGQVVGQAQSVLSRLLDGVLAETGTPRETYLALLRLSVHGNAVEREVYVRDLSDSLNLDLWAAGELVNSMLADGLVAQTDDQIQLAEPGAELGAGIRAGVGAITAPMWASFDQADLETTVRTLGEITARARAALAPAAPGRPRSLRLADASPARGLRLAYAWPETMAASTSSLRVASSSACSRSIRSATSSSSRMSASRSVSAAVITPRSA